MTGSNHSHEPDDIDNLWRPPTIHPYVVDRTHPRLTCPGFCSGYYQALFVIAAEANSGSSPDPSSPRPQLPTARSHERYRPAAAGATGTPPRWRIIPPPLTVFILGENL